MLAQRRAIRNCDVTKWTSADNQAPSRFRPPPHHSVRHGEICRRPRDRLRAWRLFPADPDLGKGARHRRPCPARGERRAERHLYPRPSRLRRLSLGRGNGPGQRYAYLAGGQNLAGTRLPAVSDTLTRHRRGILPEDLGPVCTGRRGQGLQQFQPRCAARNHGWRLSGGADMVRGTRRVHYRGRAELRRSPTLILGSLIWAPSILISVSSG